MTSTTRRQALVAAGAVALLGARPAMAEDKVRLVELKKVFPYLDLYDKLPLAERSRFELVYRLVLSGAPASTLRAAYVTGGQRTPVRLTSDLRVLNPPSAAALNGDGRIELAAPAGAKIRLDLQIAPLAAPATQMDARELVGAMAQASAAIHKAAGMMSFAAPKMERAEFKGAAGGQWVDAAGHAAPLPVVRGAPVFDPAKAPNARWVRFSKAPTSISLGPAK